MDKPNRFTATPEDIDAWLREELTDGKRLAFYQWVGAQAVTEALDALKYSLGEDPREPHAQHYHRDEVDELADLFSPEQGGPYPSVLPIGRPFCDVQWHTHTNGDGRLPTCRLDSLE